MKRLNVIYHAALWTGLQINFLLFVEPLLRIPAKGISFAPIYRSVYLRLDFLGLAEGCFLSLRLGSPS